ncbi:hypothetical protein [Neopusillimonas maritima]|uniref:LigXa-like C-terminal domain-containing protein n=1 Tax=Neopusillimonas maritima TaxID=2026239 RepID=A0ABX9MWA1_9BURK|nr:hypothetical protein [Neopusillimonas maritima]RII83245.1 hypothetical protein CJO09_06470 [Neopusillimonas maritima]
MGDCHWVANKRNDYLIDREAQRERRSFSGVEGFSMQDASLQESMGPIQNRAKENLVPTDKAISMARRMLLRHANNLDQGVSPPGLDPDSQYVRAASVLLKHELNAADWARESLQVGPNHPVFSL